MVQRCFVLLCGLTLYVQAAFVMREYYSGKEERNHFVVKGTNDYAEAGNTSSLKIMDKSIVHSNIFDSFDSGGSLYRSFEYSQNRRQHAFPAGEAKRLPYDYRQKQFRCSHDFLEIFFLKHLLGDYNPTSRLLSSNFSLSALVKIFVEYVKRKDIAEQLRLCNTTATERNSVRIIKDIWKSVSNETVKDYLKLKTNTFLERLNHLRESMFFKIHDMITHLNHSLNMLKSDFLNANNNSRTGDNKDEGKENSDTNLFQTPKETYSNPEIDAIVIELLKSYDAPDSAAGEEMEHQLRVGSHSEESEQRSLNRRRRSIDNNADKHPHNLQRIMERYKLPCAQYVSRDDSFPSKLGDLCELLSFARSTKNNVGKKSVGNDHIAATVTNDNVTQKHADLPAINHENEINRVQRPSKNKQLDEESKIVTSDEVKLEDRSGGEDEDILLQIISPRMFGYKRSRNTYSALLSLFGIPLSSSVTFNKGNIVIKDDPERKITQNIDNTQKSIGTDVEVLGVPLGLEAFVENEIVTVSEHPKTSHNEFSQMPVQPVQPRSNTSSADRQSLQNLNKDNETLERKVRSVFSHIKGHLTNDHREKHYHGNLGFIEVGLGKHVNHTKTYQEFQTVDGPELGVPMGSDGSDLVYPYPYPDPKPNDQPTVDTLCLTCKVTRFSKDSSQRSLKTLQPRSNTSSADRQSLQNLNKDNETLERNVRSLFSHIKGHLTNDHREKHYHANLGFIEAGLGKHVNHTKTYQEFQTVDGPELGVPMGSDGDLDLGNPYPYPYDQ